MSHEKGRTMYDKDDFEALKHKPTVGGPGAPKVPLEARPPLTLKSDYDNFTHYLEESSMMRDKYGIGRTTDTSNKSWFWIKDLELLKNLRDEQRKSWIRDWIRDKKRLGQWKMS